MIPSPRMEKAMTHPVGRLRRAIACSILLAPILLSGCSGRDSFSQKDFVGKWKSSRLVTPLYLRENGEWEIQKDDGAVLQYGVWQYKDKAILWSYKIDGQIGHDRNTVLSVTRREFQLREKDGSTTTFARLD